LTGRDANGSDGAMRFGTFMAPFHPVGQNPTLALERDLDLIARLDQWGFHEAWIGEHHSAGYEIIASPEVFIGVAAERTKHIRLGTGVSSLPYHHPLMLADRMVLLDHLTRGRSMLGVGPGQLTSDAHMLGIPADTQRPRMEEALDVIMALVRGETVTYECDWFTVRDARLQLRPYSDPCFDIAVAASFSPTGARAAGRHGIGMLSVAATARQGMDLLAHHWDLWEELGAESGHPADRSKWRLVGPMHLAETREQAERDVEYGIAQFSRYFTHVLPAGPVQGDTAAEIIENNKASGFATIGTPDDAIARIEELIEASGGGFGAFLLFDHDWATPAAKLRSYELFAQFVMPRFTGQLESPRASSDWVIGAGGEFVGRAANAIAKAIEDHAAERSTTVH
jgi:limonene 1,2-monooxygenase